MSFFLGVNGTTHPKAPAQPLEEIWLPSHLAVDARIFNLSCLPEWHSSSRLQPVDTSYGLPKKGGIVEFTAVRCDAPTGCSANSGQADSTWERPTCSGINLLKGTEIYSEAAGWQHADCQRTLWRISQSR